MKNNFFTTLKNKNRPPFIIIWLFWMAGSFCDVICGLISFFTLTIYRPSWDMKIRFYGSKIQNNWMMKKIKMKNFRKLFFMQPPPEECNCWLFGRGGLIKLCPIHWKEFSVNKKNKK